MTLLENIIIGLFVGISAGVAVTLSGFIGKVAMEYHMHKIGIASRYKTASGKTSRQFYENWKSSPFRARVHRAVISVHNSNMGEE